MNQNELLTRATLERLVGREVTVSFHGAKISVCTLPSDPITHRNKPCVTKESYLEPYSYQGILNKNYGVYMVSGRSHGNLGFCIPVVPVEEGKEPYHYSIEVKEGRFEYSIERK